MIISLDKIFAITILNDNDTYFFNPNQVISFYWIRINTLFLTSSYKDIQSCRDFTLPCYSIV